MKKILEFLKKYKIQSLCAGGALLLILVVALCLVLNNPPAVEEGEIPEPEPTTSSMSRLEQLMAEHAAKGDEEEAGKPNNDKPLPNYHAQLAEEMLVITRLPYQYRYMPKITAASSADDMLYYGALHIEFPYTNHPVENGNVAAVDQERLMWAVNWFNQSVMTDSRKEYGEEGYWLLPVTYIPETDQCVYSKETVSWLVEYLYGVSDYVIDCPQYDPATETYTIMASGRGGVYGTWYGESAKWIDGDTFECTYLNYMVQDITGDAPQYLLSKEDWTTRCTIRYKRSTTDPENFVFVSKKYENQADPVPTQEDLDKEVPMIVPSQGVPLPYNDKYDPQPTVSDSQLNALRAQWAQLGSSATALVAEEQEAERQAAADKKAQIDARIEELRAQQAQIERERTHLEAQWRLWFSRAEENPEVLAAKHGEGDYLTLALEAMGKTKEEYDAYQRQLSDYRREFDDIAHEIQLLSIEKNRL